MSPFHRSTTALAIIGSLILPLSCADAQMAAWRDPPQDNGRAAPDAVPVFRGPTDAQLQGRIASPARWPGAYRYPAPRNQLNVCRRSRPAFGDADFSFQGFNDAGIPC